MSSCKADENIELAASDWLSSLAIAPFVAEFSSRPSEPSIGGITVPEVSLAALILQPCSLHCRTYLFLLK